jgi:hypothetical protein
VIGAVAPILPSQRTARLCAAILDRRDTVPAPPTKPKVPRDPFMPLPLLDDGDRLWLPAHETADGFVDVLFLPRGGGFEPGAAPPAD